MDIMKVQFLMMDLVRSWSDIEYLTEPTLFEILIIDSKITISKTTPELNDSFIYFKSKKDDLFLDYKISIFTHYDDSELEIKIEILIPKSETVYVCEFNKNDDESSICWIINDQSKKDVSHKDENKKLDDHRFDRVISAASKIVKKKQN